jgi:hypothetical protein
MVFVQLVWGESEIIEVIAIFLRWVGDSAHDILGFGVFSTRSLVVKRE